MGLAVKNCGIALCQDGAWYTRLTVKAIYFAIRGGEIVREEGALQLHRP